MTHTDANNESELDAILTYFAAIMLMPKDAYEVLRDNILAWNNQQLEAKQDWQYAGGHLYTQVELEVEIAEARVDQIQTIIANLEQTVNAWRTVGQVSPVPTWVPKLDEFMQGWSEQLKSEIAHPTDKNVDNPNPTHVEGE
jgi:hypothetical protein